MSSNNSHSRTYNSFKFDTCLTMFWGGEFYIAPSGSMTKRENIIKDRWTN